MNLLFEYSRKMGRARGFGHHLGWAFVAAGLLAAGSAWALSQVSPTVLSSPEAKTMRQAASPGERWGIKVIGVRSTAANHMLEFRYRVVNADKAVPLFNPKTKPLLEHQPSGKVLAVPVTAKLGPLRNSNKPKQGRTYWMFFGNGGHLVKRGDKINVAIGDFQAKDIIVE